MVRRLFSVIVPLGPYKRFRSDIENLVFLVVEVGFDAFKMGFSEKFKLPGGRFSRYVVHSARSRTKSMPFNSSLSYIAWDLKMEWKEDILRVLHSYNDCSPS